MIISKIDHFNLLKVIIESNKIENYNFEIDDYLNLKDSFHISNSWNLIDYLEYFSNEKMNADSSRVWFILHSIIMKNLMNDKTRGKMRECVVWVGGRRAPDPHLLNNLIAKLEFFRKENDMTNPTNILMFHNLFEHVHPFEDGNGRTGRAIYICDLISAKLEIKRILKNFEGFDFKTKRQNYHNHLRDFDKEFEEWMKK